MTYLAVESLMSASPVDWLWLPLRRVMTLRRERNSQSDAILLAVSSERGVEPRPDDGGRQLPAESTIADYWLVKPGDIVFNPMWAIGGGVAASSISGAVSPAYRVYTPGPVILSRFAHYYLRCPKVIEQYALVVRGLTTFDRSVTREDFEMMPVPIPRLAVQRAIVDYLDVETTRIDALITKKRRMIELAEEKASLLLVAAMENYGFRFPQLLETNYDSICLPHDWRIMRLSQTLKQLTNGYVGPTRDILQDDGIRYIQSLHIKNGKIDFDRRPFYVSYEWHNERPRIHLRAGDVLIVQTGDIGKVAVVPENFGEASCHALQIARVRPEIVSGQYLGEYLRTPFGYQSLLSRATGALHPHLEAGIRDIPVVVPPKDIQRELLDQVKSARSSLERLIQLLTKQVNLLVERRQTLITAAVTGALVVPGVAV